MTQHVFARAARILPVAIFTIWLVTGLIIVAAPATFYALTPGVALLGPYNVHFVRDVGLVYMASGLVGLHGVRQANISLCRAAVLWSCLHSVFHLHVWMERGMPFDGLFLFDLTGVILPPFLVLACLRGPALNDGALANRP